MSAQRTSGLSTSRPTSRGEQRDQRGALARRAGLPTVPSPLFDPLGFFDDSFSLIRRIQQEMNRVFAQTGLGSMAGPGADLTSAIWVPAVELASQDGNLVVSVELPGLTDEDVTVEIRDNVLIVQGERQVEKPAQEGERGIRRTERRYGEFYRAIALPEGADAEHARAEFQDGVLRITIPVPESASNRREIPVETTASKKQEKQGQQATGKQRPAEKKPAA